MRTAILLFLLIGFFSACHKSQTDQLELVSYGENRYLCDGKTEVLIKCYRLSDQSLHFIKIRVGDKEDTLPQIVSASGVRYSTMMNWEWWEKGDEAMFNENMNNDRSIPKTCKMFS